MKAFYYEGHEVFVVTNCNHTALLAGDGSRAK